MNKKNIICRTCGAEYDAALVRCPFCGTAYAPAEEEEYMDKLEGIRDDLHRQIEEGDRRIKKGTRSTVFTVFCVIVVIVLLLFCILWFSYRREQNRSDRNKEEFLQDQGIMTQQEGTINDM